MTTTTETPQTQPQPAPENFPGKPQPTPEHFPGRPQTLGEEWRSLQEHNEPNARKAAARKAEKSEPGADPKAGHVDLSKLTPEQQEKWQKTGEFPETEAKKEIAESAAKPATEPPAAGESKQSVKAGTAPQPSALDRFLERASKEPDFEQVVQRMNEPFFAMNQEGVTRYQVLGKALSEISNREDVLYFLARPENSDVAFKMQSAEPHKIAACIHTISTELRFGRRNAVSQEPKPRAPKPPPEVGGRGTAPVDEEREALRTNDYARVQAVWDRRLREGRYSKR